MVSGENAASTGNTGDFLQWDIFMICLPMFPPFIIEQNASARKGKENETVHNNLYNYKNVEIHKYLPYSLYHSPQFPEPEE